MMKKQIKIMLSAMIAASLAGGAASAAEDFPSRDVIVTQDTDYVMKNITSSNVSIVGDDSRPDVSISEETPSITTGHGIIWINSNCKVDISHLGTLNISPADDTNGSAMGAYISSGNTVLNITDVDTVNIGTADNRFKGKFGLMTTDGEINIGTENSKVGNVNIFTTDVGIGGQHNTTPNDKYGIEINASGNVTIDGNSAAVQVMALNQGHNSGVSINADGKISLKSGTYGAIEAFDQTTDYQGFGQINIEINGKKGRRSFFSV